MPSKSRQKKVARPSAKRPAGARPPVPKKPASAKGKKPPAKSARPAAARPAPKAPAKSASASVPTPQLEVPLPEGRRHVLSLSFVRDGDEFLARLETDSGHITELKNRSLDQLLTLVASELEDLLE
jgi:hypothetical protein